MPNPEATPPRPTTFYDGDHWIRYSDHLAALAEQKKALVGPEITAAGTSSSTSALRAEIEEWKAVSAVWERRKDILGAFIQEIAATMPPPASELMLAELHKRISGESAEEKGDATSRAASAIPQRGGEIVSGSAREEIDELRRMHRALVRLAERAFCEGAGEHGDCLIPADENDGKYELGWLNSDSLRELNAILGPHSDGSARGVICEHGKTILSIDECPECEAKIRSILAPARDGASDHPPRRTNQHE